MNNPYQNIPGMNPMAGSMVGNTTNPMMNPMANPMVNPMAGMNPNQIEMMKKYAMGNGMRMNTGGPSIVDQLFKGSPVAGVGGGTSIADLNKTPPNRQVQRKNQGMSPSNEPRSETERDNLEEQNKIHHLVRNINQSLDDYAPSKSQNTEDSEDDSTEKENNNNKKNDNSGSYVPEILKEPLLIIIIYVILSQGFVRKGIGSYISYINPTQDGSVALIGYVIYGTILALLFMFFKKITIK